MFTVWRFVTVTRDYAITFVFLIYRHPPGIAAMGSNSHIDFRSGQLLSDQRVQGRSFETVAKGHIWAHESPFLPVGWAEGSAEGANPLKRIALRTAMLDQRLLTAEHFRILPWELAKLMWEMLGHWCVWDPFHPLKKLFGHD